MDKPLDILLAKARTQYEGFKESFTEADPHTPLKAYRAGARDAYLFMVTSIEELREKEGD